MPGRAATRRSSRTSSAALGRLARRRFSVRTYASLIAAICLERGFRSRAEPEVATRQVELAGRGLVQANGSSNEGRESLLIDFIVRVEVDCAPGVAFEARVEQPRRVLQRGALEECEFHDALVRLAGADRTLVRPHRNPWMRRLSPLPLLHHFGVGLFDQGAKPGEGLAPPVAQALDPCVYQLRWRLDLLRGTLLHVVTVPLLC